MNASWRLGRIGPMVITMNYTWLLLGALGLWSLALIELPPHLARAPGWLPWAVAGGTILLYGAGLLLAEAVRTWLAGRFTPGWPRSVHLFPFGAAAAYPLDALTPGRAALVALAGPAVLGLLAAGYWGAAEGLRDPGLLDAVLRVLALAHGGLALLHLIPGLPLAGGWLLVAVLRWFDKDTASAVQIAHRLGLLAVFGLLAAGVQAIIAGGDWQVGLGLVLLAWTLREGSAAVEHRVLAQEMLGQLTAREVMEPPPPTIGPATALSEVFWRRGKIDPDGVLPVQERGTFLGLLPLSLSEDSLQGTWPHTPAGRVMVPAARLPAVNADTPLPDVLSAFGQELRLAAPAAQQAEETARPGLGYVPVIEHDTLRGVIDWDQVEEYERLAADAGVQEAAALAAATAPARSPAAWFAAGLVLLLAVGLLATFGSRVIAPTLIPQPTPTPVPSTVLTFSDMTPPNGGIIGRGDTLIKIGILSTVPVEAVTMTLDGAPLAATLDQPGALRVIASVTTAINLLGPHTVQLDVQTTNGLTSRTEWTFQVVP
jgi:hypothetical protein